MEEHTRRLGRVGESACAGQYRSGVERQIWVQAGKDALSRGKMQHKGVALAYYWKVLVPAYCSMALGCHWKVLAQVYHWKVSEQGCERKVLALVYHWKVSEQG